MRQNVLSKNKQHFSYQGIIHGHLLLLNLCSLPQVVFANLTKLFSCACGFFKCLTTFLSDLYIFLPSFVKSSWYTR